MQHAIPRQITTFEFKLIGFLTLKQFLYMVVFVPLGFIAYKLFPIPYLNYAVGGLVAGAGVALALVPVNDRPLDVWIRNLIKRLTSPTQFVYHKESKSLYFLEDLYFFKNPHMVAAHVESKEKLNAYLAQSYSKNQVNKKREAINTLLTTKPQNVVVPQAAPQLVQHPVMNLTPSPKPFLLGVVRNNKKIALPALLVYVKDPKGETLRLLKTNVHGVFATFKAVPHGEYLFEIKDPGNRYFFDTMKLRVQDINPVPFEFYSKEML